MTNDSCSRITCKCGKTIQQRNFSQHCSSKHHVSFITKQELNETNKLSSIDLVFNLAAYLRENDLRSNKIRTQTIVQRYEHIDPYTKVKLKFQNNETIPANFHIDHIHEAQILASAIKHAPELVPRDGNVLALRPLRSIVNDISNLAITEAFINRSKGQAIKYFLGHYETNRAMPLLVAFIQTANGKERSIAKFSKNIVDLIKETSPNMSNAIREIRMDNGHVTGACRYEMVAEQFDTIIDRMKLDWNEGTKLRNGKVYQAYK
ncbi:unnamed protein product [Rotaria magnacalcarata]|uniref:Uncharacterized protein n=1 Tax=Rotaria magnacalcarata TaxID=392030 RepID=A0A816YUP9_9BILA|nr:unnamed protein product [Rotaria magnacalcarata]CAF1638761.1 unnamed protein product [Rotaria magnacalcarata]CAF1934368.1 unnamed protein product [Rotaria magnacalcarata]CAF2056695.1 unnamed protein product [Rotaria magnacalcarata]CAF2169304.1 unnamed protein product [Rotaria magnacalcarata]